MAATRCQCAECVALDARVRLAAAEGDRLGDAFRARTASMEHVPGCECKACRGVPRKPESPFAPGPDTPQRPELVLSAPLMTDIERSCCRGIGGHEEWCRSGAAVLERAAEHPDLDDEDDRCIPQPPTEECARCHVVGPVDVPCLGCAAREPATEVHGLEEWLRGGRVPRHYPPSSDPDRDPGAAGRAEPPCCARVGEWWCTEPIGHKPPCVSPTREVETPRSKR